MPLFAKAEILETAGSFITSVKSHNLLISLYAYAGVYVEVFHSISKKLVAIRILEDKKRLRLYTKNIDIQTLLNQSLLCFMLICTQCEN
jgi:replication fork clamp-binding protein CrfC